MKRKRGDLSAEEEDDCDEQPLAKRSCVAAAPLDALPDELIAYICNYLDWKSMPVFRFTCRRFYRLVNDWINVQRKRGQIPAFAVIPRYPENNELVQRASVTCYLVEKGTETDAWVTRLPLVRVVQRFYRGPELLTGFPYDNLDGVQMALDESYFTDGVRNMQLCVYEEYCYFVWGIYAIKLKSLEPSTSRGGYYHQTTARCTIIATNCLEDWLLWRQQAHKGRFCENCEALLKYHTSLTE